MSCSSGNTDIQRLVRIQNIGAVAESDSPMSLFMHLFQLFKPERQKSDAIAFIFIAENTSGTDHTDNYECQTDGDEYRYRPP